jgi:hypothetical protein
MPAILNGCSYGVKDYGVEVDFNGMTSLLNFKNLPSGSRVDGEIDTKTEMHIEKMVISLTYIFPLGINVGYKQV